VGKHSEMLRSRINSLIDWLPSSQKTRVSLGGGKRKGKQGNKKTQLLELFHLVKT